MISASTVYLDDVSAALFRKGNMDKMNMKEFDGNWNFDRSKFIVCRRHYLDPLMFMTRKEWSMRNVVLRENKEVEWIETLHR